MYIEICNYCNAILLTYHKRNISRTLKILFHTIRTCTYLYKFILCFVEYYASTQIKPIL